jgi:nicotinamidase-related amidase
LANARRGSEPRSGGTGRAAILALDLISDFEFPDGPRVRRALAARSGAILRLLAAARAGGVPVLYANDNLGLWRSDFPSLLEHCTEAHRPGAELALALAPHPQDEILLKPRHSAFYGTPLEFLLESRDIGTLVILGVSTESCVWMTASDAHTRGFSLVVPRDTVAGAAVGAHRAALANLGSVLGARLPARASSLRFRHGRLPAR